MEMISYADNAMLDNVIFEVKYDQSYLTTNWNNRIVKSNVFVFTTIKISSETTNISDGIERIYHL